MDLNLINWLKDSKYRIRILNFLENQSFLSSELATKLDINRASMSRLLKGLKGKGLVTSFSDRSRTITYTLTKEGRKIIKRKELKI